MKTWQQLLFYTLSTLVKLLRPTGTKAVISENIMLKQQLLVLNRKNNRSPRLTVLDRILFGFLTSFIKPKRLSKIAVILKPATLIMFHKALIKRKYSKLFSNKNRRKPGPKGPSQEMINIIVEMKTRNPRFGARRIAMQINNTFETLINKDVVLRVLAKHYKPNGGDGPSWLTFIGHMKDSLWSVDLFRTESILLKTHWVMVVMDQFTRRIMGFAVHSGTLNGMSVCYMFNKVISSKSLPKYLSSDNDPLFTFHRWRANLRVLEIEEIKSVPQQPRSHPFIERLIRICRNEVLDRTLFWNSLDLQTKLDRFQEYFNKCRAHMGINGFTPMQKADDMITTPISTDVFRWQSYCHGLFQLPVVA